MHVSKNTFLSYSLQLREFDFYVAIIFLPKMYIFAHNICNHPV
jgi:hypothetical protein